jgi:hypothetical protein
MTKQTKIPVPEVDEGKARAATLIERVVRNYDLVQLQSAPIPDNLIPPASKRRRYRRADDVVEDAEVTPVAEPAAAPAAEAPEVLVKAAPRPEVVEPEVIAPQPALRSNVPAPVAMPVRFRGERHPVNRQHLREQGLIVPEGSVTGLWGLLRSGT